MFSFVYPSHQLPPTNNQQNKGSGPLIQPTNIQQQLLHSSSTSLSSSFPSLYFSFEIFESCFTHIIITRKIKRQKHTTTGLQKKRRRFVDCDELFVKFCVVGCWLWIELGSNNNGLKKEVCYIVHCSLMWSHQCESSYFVLIALCSLWSQCSCVVLLSSLCLSSHYNFVIVVVGIDIDILYF